MFAAINELELNAVWYSELDDQIHSNTSYQEVADAIRLRLNDKDALPPLQ